MNILKKITNVIFWVILAICLIIPIVTYAKDLSLDEIKRSGAGAVGNTVIMQPGFNTGHNLYCINYPEHWPTGQRMNIQSYIEIMGNKATNAKGETIDNIYNGVIAYGVNKSSGENPYVPCLCGKHNHGFSTGQVILWDYLGAWYNQVGSKLGVHCTIVGTSGRCEPIGDPFGEAAKMNNVSLKTDVTNHTNTSDLKPEEFTLEDEKWIEVGPYKYEFGGSVTGIEVTDQNGLAVNGNNYKICGRDSSGKRTTLSTVPSNQNFYVAVKMKKGYESINVKVNAKVEGTLYGAKLWFLTTNAGQNLLLSEPKTETVSDNFDFNFDIDLKQDIGIEKENVKYEDVKLKKVGFIVENAITGKYINKDDSGKITYVAKANATTFFTNDTGKIKIEKVLMGEYNFYEVFNEEPGYEPNPDKPYKVNNITKTAKYDILKNTPVRGNIHIEKVDKDIPTYKLDDVDFIIEQIDTDGKPGKGFVQSGGSTVGEKSVYGENGTKGARETAKVFTTSSNEEDKGQLTVYELEIGYTYYFWEVRNDHSGYAISSDPYEVTITQDNIDKSRTYYATEFKNERKFVDLAGFVWKDGLSGKVSKYNNIYITLAGDSKDSKEAIKDGSVIVRLINTKHPEKSMETTTTKGDYSFKQIEIKEIEEGNYYIEFEYDGLIYQNVEAYNVLDKVVWEQIGSETKTVKEAIIEMAIEGKAIGKGGKDLTEEEKKDLPETYPVDYLTEEDKEAWYQRTVNERGSKAIEKDADRKALHDSFAKVEGIEGNATNVSVKNREGTEVGQVEYELEDYGAKIKSNTLAPMTANTINTGTEIVYDRTSIALLESGVLTGFNLGLYERPQTNIALGQDLEKVEVSIKGTTAVYTKASKNKAGGNGEFDDGVWNNVGVIRFGDKEYDQPVYRADFMYGAEENSNVEDGQKLHMYFTYKIALRNKSTLTTKINEIEEYCDARFSTNKEDGFKVYIGTAKGEEVRDITPDIADNGTSTEMKKFKIECNEKLGNSEISYVYIKFPLNREKIADTFNVEELPSESKLSSVAEIISYTTYKNEDEYAIGQTYAAVDENAVANNINNSTEGIDLLNEQRYEDDTDKAADAKLYIADSRKIKGIAFEDNAVDKGEANIREGSGAYEDGETKIENVEVQLIELEGESQTEKLAQVLVDNPEEEDFNKFINAQEMTTAGGEYSFEGFTPGTYIVRFIWGNDGNHDSHKVTEYKATIVDKTEYDEAKENPYYYRDIERKYGTNKSRATDNTTMRQDIDKELRTHIEGTTQVEGNNYATKIEELEKRTMESNTQPMTFDIEYKGSDILLIDLQNNKLQFIVNGMNLGIIRRPVQNIEIEKRVSNVTVKYSSEEAIINADIDKEGKLTGETNNIAYIGKSTNRRQAQIKVELDNEVLENSGVDVTYEFTIKNVSEKDYTSIDFQRFGTQIPDTDNQRGQIVTLTPSKIMDYIGNEANLKVCQENENNGWSIVTAEAIGSLVHGDVKDSEQIKATKMYKTEKLEDTPIEPQNEKTINMVVEKRLTTAEDSNITNQVEIIQVNKPDGYNSGSPVMSKDENNGYKLTTFGNYIPSGISAITEPDDSMAETVIIMPSTGGDRNYIPEIAIGITALVALAGGIYFIKKIVTK